jgi:hypothetical protein
MKGINTGNGSPATEAHYPSDVLGNKAIGHPRNLGE